MRRSTRTSSAHVSSPASTTKHKRGASNGGETVSSKKAKKSQQSTPTKSKYFEASGSDDDEDHEPSATSEDEDGSEFGQSSSAAEAASAEEDSEDEETDDEPTPRRKTLAHRSKKPTTPGSARSNKENGSDVWRPGVKTGLGPGTQVIIKKPKARPAGKIPYTDDTIHPNTLLFLGDLVENNNRDWLKLHDPDFRASEKDFHSFVEKMTEKLMEVDDTIPELPVKDVVFRIYRDVRFSKNPLPYKPFFSVAWSRTGRKSSYAHYYLQIAPAKSFIGAGIWHPEAGPNAAVRRDIDRNSRRIKDVLSGKRIREEFLENAGKTDSQVVKAFVKSNSENALKTKPKGYDADHPDIELLRLRNYTIGRRLADDEVLGQAGAQRIADLFKSLEPFVTYLNSVVMPDTPGEEADEEEDSAESDASE